MTKSSLQPMPIGNILEPPAPKLLMPQVGLTNSDGQSITQPSSNPDTELASILARMTARFKPVEPPSPVMTPVIPRPVPMTKPIESSQSEQPREKPLREDLEAQDQLTLLLSQAYASQHTYGDKAAMMEYRDQMFQQVLAPYPIALIRDAFVEHIRRNNALPTPADIINIIDPPEPEPNMAAYIGIRSKLKDKFVTDREREYLRWCEQRAMREPKEWKERISQLELRMEHTDDQY